MVFCSAVVPMLSLWRRWHPGWKRLADILSMLGGFRL